jgi:hypothetical protein
MLADFVSEAAKNPIAGIGKIIALKLAADMAGAGIGAAAKGALEKALGSVGSSGGFSISGAAITAVGALSIFAGLVSMIADSAGDEEEERVKKAGDKVLSKEEKAKALAARVGGMSPKEAGEKFGGDAMTLAGFGEEASKTGLNVPITGPAATAFEEADALRSGGMSGVEQLRERLRRKPDDFSEQLKGPTLKIHMLGEEAAAKIQESARKAGAEFGAEAARVLSSAPTGPNRSNEPTKPTVK